MPFAGGNGLKKEMASKEPMDFFDLLFEATMWGTLADETNRYYEQQHPTLVDLPPHSRYMFIDITALFNVTWYMYILTLYTILHAILLAD